MTSRSNTVTISTLCATALVVGLSILALVPFFGFCTYPLLPGISISGVLFSSTVETEHLLRFEVAAVLLNIAFYTGVFYLLFTPSRVRRRRTFSEYYPGSSRAAVEKKPAEPRAIEANNPAAEPQELAHERPTHEAN